MTVIAAKVIDGNIHFASDSQTSAGYRRVTSKEIKVNKLHQVNGMTIGGSGLLAHSLWLIHFAKNHAPEDATQVAVSNFMVEFLEWMRKKDCNFTTSNRFLLAFRNCLFEIDEALSVFAVSQYSAIGSGADYAIALLHAGHHPDQAALVASQLDVYCSGEIQKLVHSPSQ